MKQEEKELLLKDLCARLPYDVKIALKNSEAYHHNNVAKKGDITIDKLKGFDGSYFSIYHDNPLDWDWYVSDIDVENIKPYLFPLSSMTKEDIYQIKDILGEDFEINKDGIIDLIHNRRTSLLYFELDALFSYFDKNHFDYRGLIPIGLAIDATNLNIY